MTAMTAPRWLMTFALVAVLPACNRVVDLRAAIADGGARDSGVVVVDGVNVSDVALYDGGAPDVALYDGGAPDVALVDAGVVDVPTLAVDASTAATASGSL